MARRYWQLLETDDDHWIVDTKNQLGDLMKKRRGIQKGNLFPDVRAIEPWTDPLPVECASAGPYYDMPSSSSFCVVMSDRFREVVEKVAPGAVQFMPIQPTYRRKPLPCGVYWAGNVVNVYDCVDFEASGCESYYPDAWIHSGEKDLHLIDSKIPEDASIFQLKNQLNKWIVTERVKRAMQAAKLTGIEYLRMKTT